LQHVSCAAVLQDYFLLVTAIFSSCIIVWGGTQTLSVSKYPLAALRADAITEAPTCSTAGDVNGDGTDDLIFQYKDRLWILYGNKKRVLKPTALYFQ
jgi:hypothetical protein